MAIPRVLRATALLLTAVASACSGGGSAESGEGYNVLLISLDSTRRDLLGVYGNDPRHAPGVSPSPNMDALAARGVVMRDAYATTSWTLPSHMTLLTGQPELVHAVEIDYLRPDPSRHTLASVLQARGYRTAGFFTGPYLDARFGFARGFDVYEPCYGPTLTAASARLAEADRRLKDAAARGDFAGERAAMREKAEAEVAVDGLSHKDQSSAAVVDRSIEAMRAARDAGEPFFLFAHFFDPHYDYVPPAGHNLFDPLYTGPIDGEDFWTNEAVSRFAQTPSGRQRVVDDRGLQHIIALYEGELHWTDAQVGRLLDALSELDLADNTLVVITADHGDEFFEHDGIGHRRTLYEEVVQVPMLLAMPGVLPEGAVVEGLASNVDVFGTVLELLGLPAVPGTHSASLLPLIRGADDGADRNVFGRLTTQQRISFSTMHDGRPVDGALYAVEETFRVGSIKVRRRREWPERTQENLPDSVAAQVDQAAQGMARETVSWIDIGRFPAEPDSAWSTSFPDGAPLEALRAFHDRYNELVRDRRSAGIANPDEGPVPGMGGLGYADGVEVQARSEKFVLAAPGAELLRSR